jgi:chemotaxis protein methyltransferase CheR
MGFMLESGRAVSGDIGDHLSDRHFTKLARYIEEYSGIKMPPGKRTMVEGRLRRRVRATGHTNFASYCDYLFSDEGLEAESVHLIDAVTTNKTDFFREPEHFRILADKIVPEIFSRSGGRSPVKVWSAACSIGAEPYTLAMVLADLAQRMAGLRWSLVATDICTEALASAVAGIYPEEMVQPVPAELRTRYVLRAKNRARAEVRIVPALRAMVQFARLNLMQAPYPIERDMDIIFLRNILIYFDKPTQQSVLSNLCSHLRVGGHMFLGHSETLAGFDLPLELAGPTVFRKTG